MRSLMCWLLVIGTNGRNKFDNIVHQITDHYEKVEFASDPSVTDLCFFLKLNAGMAIIEYSFEDKYFHYDAEVVNDTCMQRKSAKSYSLRELCKHIRDTDKLSLKKMVFVHGGVISIGFYEHFGMLSLGINCSIYSIFDAVYYRTTGFTGVFWSRQNNWLFSNSNVLEFLLQTSKTLLYWCWVRALCFVYFVKIYVSHTE